jgi:hypothetical protein
VSHDPPTLSYATPVQSKAAPPNRRAFAAAACCAALVFLRFVPLFPEHLPALIFVLLSAALVFSVGAIVHAVRRRVLGCGGVVGIFCLLFSVLAGLVILAMMHFPVPS